jgi:hypothetical protein
VRRGSRLLIDEHPLQVQPSLAELLGLNEALILQQLHYWLQRSKHHRDGRDWIYNTLDDWQRQFPFWSKRTIQRTLTALRSSGLLLTGNYNTTQFDRTIWYSIDYDALHDAMWSKWPDGGGQNVADPSGQNDAMDGASLATPIPETTQQTNQKGMTLEERLAHDAEWQRTQDVLRRRKGR